ncbi:MAG: helix-turn-helix transcriptional regulator, partial [Dehalococcoidia bacterium]
DILELISSADEGVYAVNSEQKIILWNKRAQEILGYSPEEVINRECYELMVGRDAHGNVTCAQDCPFMKAAISTGRAPSHYCAVRDKEGKSIWLHITHVVIPSQNGELDALVHIFRDVTEYMEARELVERLLSYLAVNPAGAADTRRALEGTSKKRPVSLTNRERQVLALLARGATASVVARELVISPATARNHIQNILSKLSVHSALEAVVYASKNGLL